MSVTRRGWLAGAGAIGAATAVEAHDVADQWRPASPQASERPPAPPFRVTAPGAGTRDYTAALEALRAYALEEVQQLGLPGMTISVTDADGFVALLPIGWADVEHGLPLTSDRYFQIGSISKSFIALTMLALADQGRVDLSSPVSRYLPDVPLPPQPVTLLQLLSHTGGLPDGAPFFPRTPDARLWCGFAPGSGFSYSNTGFDLLGAVIARVTKAPFEDSVEAWVRQKLGLGDMKGVLAQATRSQFAVGYWPWDRTVAATLPGGRLQPATFDELAMPAGSIGATAAQMAVYMRALMSFARGSGAPVLTDASARRFATPVTAAAEFGPGAQYALGVALQPVDGLSCLHHTGGMMAYASSFHADPAAGVACFASANAMLDDELYRPRQVTRYAIQLMRAVRSGAALPPPPDAMSPWRVKDPAACSGTFVGPNGALTLAPQDVGLTLVFNGKSGRALQRGPNRLVTDHPDLRAHGLDAVVEGGRILGWWWGESLFSRDAAKRPPATPAALRALTGLYLNRDPWSGRAVVVARGDSLVLEGAGVLTERAGYWARGSDPGGIERFRFEAVMDGRPQRLNASGIDLLRLTL
ncbi:MAG: beta-lactamase family protein [Caulobacteraceae bacterium]|nr:beta-lactamase family protein [Caulobacteraceae bacterium]